MSDQRTSYAKVVIVSIVVSALVATAFGFVAGFIAASGAWSESVLSSLPPVVRRIMPRQQATSGGSDGGYSLPEMRDLIKPKTQEEQVVAVVHKASPAVVSIVITKDMPVYEQYQAAPDDFFSQFFGGFSVPQYRQKGTENQEIGAGTGFFVSADGYIVTNRHVVSDEQAEYTVVTTDQTKYPAKIIGRDPSNDIAVLKIEAKDQPFVVLGDSDQIKVGQSVIVIGFALGKFGNSVSVGIVSGLQRQITADDSLGQSENLSGVIQTDAAINPGNSGGPLLDLKGEAIGINVAIVQGSQNIGFSLPINDVRKVVDSVKATGRIVRPWLGIRYVIITPELQKANSLPVDHGALIVRGDNQTDLAVVPGSPADKAGLVENDIVLEVAGKKVTSDEPLNAALERFGVGDEVKLKVLHRGEETEMTVILAERPQS